MKRAVTSVPGQALTEFALLLSIVSLVCLVGLITFNSSLSTALASLPFFSHAKSVSAPSGSGTSSSTSSGTTTSKTGSTTGVATANINNTSPGSQIVLADGTVINLPNPVLTMPGSLGTTIETSGVNGTTELLALQLDAIVKQLQADGKITPAQASSLADLANQGHKFATIEGILAQEATDPNVFLGTHLITFDGVTYVNGNDLSSIIGVNPYGNGSGNGKEYDKLMSLFDAAVASGSLSDPTVKQLVNGLVVQIATIGETVEEQTDFVAQPNYNLDIYAAAAITNKDSATVCQGGGGVDFGTYCN